MANPSKNRPHKSVTSAQQTLLSCPAMCGLLQQLDASSLSLPSNGLVASQTSTIVWVTSGNALLTSCQERTAVGKLAVWKNGACHAVPALRAVSLSAVHEQSMRNDTCEVRPGDIWLVTGNEEPWKYFVIPIKQCEHQWELWECKTFEAPGNASKWNLLYATDWKLPRPNWLSDQAQLICRA